MTNWDIFASVVSQHFTVLDKNLMAIFKRHRENFLFLLNSIQGELRVLDYPSSLNEF